MEEGGARGESQPRFRRLESAPAATTKAERLLIAKAAVDREHTFFFLFASLPLFLFSFLFRFFLPRRRAGDDLAGSTHHRS